MRANGSANSSESSLKIRGLRPSGPAALAGFNFFNRFKTPSWVMLILVVVSSPQVALDLMFKLYELYLIRQASGPRRTRVFTKEFIENAHPSVREVSFVDEADPYLTHAKEDCTGDHQQDNASLSVRVSRFGEEDSLPGGARPVGGRRDEPTPKKDYEIVSPECGELRILRYNSGRHDSTSMIFGRQITAVEAKVKYKFRLRGGSVRHVSYAMPIPTPGLQKEFTGKLRQVHPEMQTTAGIHEAKLWKDRGDPGSSNISEPFLLVADSLGEIILQVNITSGLTTTLPLGDVGQPYALDHDPLTDYVYWTDDLNDKIHRARRDGSDRETILDITGFSFFALKMFVSSPQVFLCSH
ncbi:hypothetical protein Bbelb_239410 [Branchiostoma belcheri]|nr:hypothetical protein Bbelb_239410 [Branchiostoma belcheri]